MTTVLLVIHLMITIALVAVVLLQRSEGGALGIGGGGGGGGLMSGRGAANLLTRTTAILAVSFMLTSLVLSLIAKNQGERGSILDTGGDAPPPLSEPLVPAAPSVPEAPAAPAPPAEPSAPLQR